MELDWVEEDSSWINRTDKNWNNSFLGGHNVIDPQDVAICQFEQLIPHELTFETTVLDAIGKCIICIFGLIVNFKFLGVLKLEKQNRRRKFEGNLTEPIMTLYSRLQICYWPLFLILQWLVGRAIISLRWFPTWTVPLAQLFIDMGRVYIAFNSLFTASIRLYFVTHNGKVTKFQSKKIKRLFCYGSIGIPIILAILHRLVSEIPARHLNNKFLQCVENSVPDQHSDNTSLQLRGNSTTYLTPFYALSSQFMPQWLIIFFSYFCKIILCIVFSNVIEGFIYTFIFVHKKR